MKEYWFLFYCFTSPTFPQKTLQRKTSKKQRRKKGVKIKQRKNVRETQE
jgi:hypothetical protein